jgi:hypothetical protein
VSKLDYKSGFLFDTANLYNPETQKRVQILVDRGTARTLRSLLEDFVASVQKAGSSSAVEPRALASPGEVKEADVVVVKD